MKVDRVYVGNKEKRKMYKDGKLNKIFFDEKAYSGEIIDTNNIRKCNIENMKIKGKTYQNLFAGGEWVQKHLSGVVQSNRISNTLRIAIKQNTVYILEILKDETSNILVGVDGFSDSTYNYKTFSLGWKDGEKLSFKITDTTITHIGILLKRKDDSVISINDSDVLSLNIKILEGDYTDIDIPTSIDGIESVGEREFKKSKNLCPYLEKNSLNNSGEEINLNGDLRSPYIYLNSGIYVTSNNRTFRPTNVCIYDLNKKFEIVLKSVNTFSLESSKYVRLFGSSTNREKFQLEEGTVPTEYEPFYEYYPEITRNYNYKCETDDIVLPNGIKNSIETINGKKVHTQRVGKVILDGSQKISGSALYYHKKVVRVKWVNTNLKIGRDNSYCDKFSYKNDDKDTQHYKLGDDRNTAFFYIPIEYTNNINSYFKENPTSLYYEFIEYIYTPLYNSNEMPDTPMLPSGLQDELTLTDTGFKRIQKMNTKTLNGTETWYIDNSSTGLAIPAEDRVNVSAYTFISDKKNYGNSSDCYNNPENILCDTMEVVGYNYLTGNLDDLSGIGGVEKRIIISIPKSELETSDLDGFKKYLSSNPVTVTYELETSKLVDTTSSYPVENDTFGITLPLGQKDEIKDGYIHKNVFKLVIDDNISFNFPTSLVKDSTVLISMTISSIPKLFDATISAISDKLKFKNIYDLDESGFFIDKTGKNLYCRIPILTYGSTLEEIKQGLSENPITIWYPTINTIKIPIKLTYKLDEPLRSLPNIYDTIENNQLIQRVGKVVLDGSDDEYWVNGYGSGDGKNNRFEVGFNYAMGVTTNRTIYGLSDKFSYFNTSGIPPRGCFRMVLNTANRLFILFNPSTDLVPLEDLSAWKAWLSENPVTVYYELATPTETEITPDMILINGEPITDTVGIELPDGNKDCIENDYYVKNVSKKVFMGDDTIYSSLTITDDYVKACYRNLPNFKRAKTVNIVSNVNIIDYNFTDTPTDISISSVNSLENNYDEIDIIIPLSLFSDTNITLDMVNEYLRNNPVTVYYELLEPERIPLFSMNDRMSQITSLNNIKPTLEGEIMTRNYHKSLVNTWTSGDIDWDGSHIESTTSYISNVIDLSKHGLLDLCIDKFEEIQVNVHFYDKDNNYISSEASLSDKMTETIIIPDNATIAYITCTKEAELYVKVFGTKLKNLVDPTPYTLTANGTYVVNSNFRNNKKNIKPSSIYTILTNIISTDISGNFELNYFNFSGSYNPAFKYFQYIKSPNTLQGRFVKKPLTSLTKNELLICPTHLIVPRIPSTVTSGSITCSHILIPGDWTDKQVPDNVYLEQLVGYKRILPSGVKNTVEIINGNRTLVERIGKVVLNGKNANVTEHMFTNNNYFCAVLTDNSFMRDSNFINIINIGNLKVASNNIMTAGKTTIGINKRIIVNDLLTVGVFIRISRADTGVTDINSFYTWLESNPQTIYYELANYKYTILD